MLHTFRTVHDMDYVSVYAFVDIPIGATAHLAFDAGEGQGEEGEKGEIKEEGGGFHGWFCGRSDLCLYEVVWG
jgi:hypothetical protein